MKLIALNPRWAADYDILVKHGELDDILGPAVVHDPDRTGMGITFACPHCVIAGVPAERAQRLGLFFANPVDGKPHTDDVPLDKLWTRAGTSFHDLTLTPSIDASASGHWHGFITNGEIR